MEPIGSVSGKIEASAAIPNPAMCGSEPSQIVRRKSCKRPEANCEVPPQSGPFLRFRRSAPNGRQEERDTTVTVCSFAHTLAKSPAAVLRLPHFACFAIEGEPLKQVSERVWGHNTHDNKGPAYHRASASLRRR